MGLSYVASEFIPRWTSNEAEDPPRGGGFVPPRFAPSILEAGGDRLGAVLVSADRG